jgi:hypothetical protein
MSKKDQKIEDAIYEKVAQEVQRNDFQLGLMAKATAKSQGDRNLAQSLYIQFRVEQLMQDVEEAASKQNDTADDLKQQSRIIAKADFHRKNIEKLKRAIPQIKFFFCWIVITFIYLVGTSLRIPHWPGLVNIPASELIETFLDAAIWPMIIACEFWLPISFSIGLVVWLWQKIKHKEQKSRTLFFFPILILISFILIFLDLTGTSRYLTSETYGQEGLNDSNRSGPWYISAETISNYKISKSQSNINNTQVIQNPSYSSQNSQTTKNEFDPSFIIGALLLTGAALKLLIDRLRINKSNSNTNSGPSLISVIWPYIFGLGFVCWAIAQFIAGYGGISNYAGSGWAIAAIVVSFIFRFTLPITIGAFYGAMTVWDWPWYYALLFSAPGLALVLPGILMSILGNFNRD